MGEEEAFVERADLAHHGRAHQHRAAGDEISFLVLVELAGVLLAIADVREARVVRFPVAAREPENVRGLTAKDLRTQNSRARMLMRSDDQTRDETGIDERVVVE